MGRYPRIKKSSPYLRFLNQYHEVLKTYRNIESAQVQKDRFEIVMDITPSENSETYKVSITYQLGYRPRATLLFPALEKHNGKYPHHIYGWNKDGTARLCVYCPRKDEWNSDLPIASSFIPWVSTWLNTYEYWLITGEWHYDEVIDYQDKKE